MASDRETQLANMTEDIKAWLNGDAIPSRRNNPRVRADGAGSLYAYDRQGYAHSFISRSTAVSTTAPYLYLYDIPLDDFPGDLNEVTRELLAASDRWALAPADDGYQGRHRYLARFSYLQTRVALASVTWDIRDYYPYFSQSVVTELVRAAQNGCVVSYWLMRATVSFVDDTGTVTRVVPEDGPATYLDFAEELFSFTPKGKEFGGYGGANRNTAKPAKIVRQMLHPQVVACITDAQFEAFANTMKSVSVRNKTELTLVNGEDIRYWYHQDHYDPAIRGSSMIYSSCMCTASAQNKLDIYCSNPNQVELLICKNGDNQLQGRVLVWLAMDGKKYHDYIYASGHVADRMKQHLTKLGIPELPGDAKVKLDNPYHRLYPSIDRMRVLDAKTGILRRSGGTQYWSLAIGGIEGGTNMTLEPCPQCQQPTPYGILNQGSRRACPDCLRGTLCYRCGSNGGTPTKPCPHCAAILTKYAEARKRIFQIPAPDRISTSDYRTLNDKEQTYAGYGKYLVVATGGVYERGYNDVWRLIPSMMHEPAGLPPDVLAALAVEAAIDNDEPILPEEARETADDDEIVDDDDGEENEPAW